MPNLAGRLAESTGRQCRDARKHGVACAALRCSSPPSLRSRRFLALPRLGTKARALLGSRLQNRLSFELFLIQ